MICYLINMLLCRAHLAIGIVDQFWWAANRTLAEQDLRRGVFYKHKCRVFLVCSYRAIKCYLVSMWLCITHLAIGSVDQLRWAANSTLAEQDLWRVCCINTKVGFIWYAPHRAIICYLLNKQLCRAHLAIGSLDKLQWAANRALAEQDLRRVCCINTKVGFMICSSRAIICYLLNM